MQQEFRKYIRALRIDRGYKLTDIGAGIGCSDTTMSRLETKEYTKPTMRRLIYISRLEKLYGFVPLSLVTRYIYTLDERYASQKRVCGTGWSDFSAKTLDVKDYASFGVFLKALRKYRNKNTIGFYIHGANYGYTILSYVEANKRTPSFNLMAEVAKYLEVDLLYLLSCYLYFDTSYRVPASRVELYLEKGYKRFQAVRQRTIMRKKVRENAV